MKKVLATLRSAVFVLLAGSLLAVPAEAGPRLETKPYAAGHIATTVQADCYAIGQQVAAQNGGTLARASLSNQGGRAVCVIVVVTPGKDGQRGRRQEIVVPAG